MLHDSPPALQVGSQYSVSKLEFVPKETLRAFLEGVKT